jgi:hypothetical protein
MSSATADHIIVRAPSAPPERPSRVAEVDPTQLRVIGGDHRQTHDDRLVLVARQVNQKPVKSAVVVDFVDDCYIACDLAGAVYGTGPSDDEALADFYRALDDHLAFLRTHLDELHPRLERQLALLQRLFPEN